MEGIRRVLVLGIVLIAGTVIVRAPSVVGLGVGSCPSNRATEGSNPKGTRLYFMILLKNVEFFFYWH